jgi:hypothetical protein
VWISIHSPNVFFPFALPYSLFFDWIFTFSHATAFSLRTANRKSYCLSIFRSFLTFRFRLFIYNQSIFSIRRILVIRSLALGYIDD